MKRMVAVVALVTGMAYGATVNFPDAMFEAIRACRRKSKGGKTE